MSIPVIGRQYKIIHPINKFHYGEVVENKVGDIIKCDDYHILDSGYVEFRSWDLHWEGNNGNDVSEPFGMIPGGMNSWEDVLELVQE